MAIQKKSLISNLNSTRKSAPVKETAAPASTVSTSGPVSASMMRLSKAANPVALSKKVASRAILSKKVASRAVLSKKVASRAVLSKKVASRAIAQ